MPAASPVVSVVVPARNAARKLPGLLEALARQTIELPFEALIVDDGSSDGTARVVEAGAGAARVVSPGGHVGVYAARNAGLDEARADVIAFTDADCVPADDWIEQGLAALEQTGADMLAGAFATPLPRHPSTASLVDVTHNYDQERYAGEGHSAGGNTWVRRHVFDAVGRFDASLRSSGDREFVRRAVDAGFVLAYAPDVVVAHDPVERARDLVKRSFRQGFGKAQLGSTDVTLRTRRGGAYVTSAHVVARLRHSGQGAGTLRVARILLAKNAFLRAPALLGSLAGTAVRSPLGRRVTGARFAGRS